MAAAWPSPRDPVTAYRWYGLALLRGAEHVKANMDLLWQEISSKRPDQARALVAYFESRGGVLQDQADGPGDQTLSGLISK